MKRGLSSRNKIKTQNVHLEEKALDFLRTGWEPSVTNTLLPKHTPFLTSLDPGTRERQQDGSG